MIWRGLCLIFMLGCIQPLYAQICTGSLGDPIINITFGSGQNPGPALPGAATNYQYVSADCPQDGFYAVRNSSIACHGDTWHSITDHTGDQNGYFMLVNASVFPGAFYVETVNGLCGNTTYEFAAWVLNILKASACGGAGIQPNLTFRLEKTDGSILQVYNTGNIPASATPVWKQYGFFFTTPPNVTDVVLRIINNAQGGCGNDLALDDITFRPCGPQISTAIAGIASNAVSLCEGTSQSYTFTALVSTGFNNPVVQWQERYNGGTWNNIPGATAVTYSRNFSTSAQPGTYQFRLAAAESGNMSAAQCRIASLPLTVDISSNPALSANNNSPLCEGKTIMLTASNNAVWTGPNGFVASGSSATISNARTSHSGMYYVTSVNGSCSRTDSTVVTVNPMPVITISRNIVDICKGDTLPLNIAGAVNYSWAPVPGLSYSASLGLLVYTPDSSVYLIKGTNSYGCSDSVSLQVHVYRAPVANAGSDVAVIEGTGVQLSGSVKGDSLSFYWSPAISITGIQSLSPWVFPLSDTSYILHVNSYYGCGSDEDTVRVHVYKKLIIPNVFSPNKDGINDEWTIKGIESYPGAEVSLFDRYGRQVFSTRRFESWNGTANGKPVAQGVYYYFINILHGLPIQSGWLLLIR